MEQYEELQKRQITEFHVEEQQPQQQQQMNPFLQKTMMDHVLQQQSKSELQKGREKVAENMPKTLKEKKGKEATPFSPEITKQLENHVEEMFDSDSFKRWLRTLSAFPNYSLNNTLLISMQQPNATKVCGY